MLNYYIGLRGAGKSAFGVKIARKYLKKGIPVYSNYAIKGCYLIDTEDIGYFEISNCCLIVDEGGSEISSRDFLDKNNKSTSKPALRWWRESRKHGVSDIYIFSQTMNVDKQVRELIDQLYIIKKGILPNFSRIYTLKPTIQPNQSEGYPTVFWDVPKLPKLFYRKPYYKFYDSYDVEPLPYKEFKIVE